MPLSFLTTYENSIEGLKGLTIRQVPWLIKVHSVLLGEGNNRGQLEDGNKGKVGQVESRRNDWVELSELGKSSEPTRL
ncbi:hypothetical protein SLEP1_g55258 [Rubroshorea leprosula]|uniref:Uncharacterized protein n=1 Tax=Rubroshorea leprosula TaxID=152421 RepID=A0AAV5MEX2_9ROSI|nr:hypothetical protein SLEP1_g55258 [Rubroshorea leprosula]